MVKHQNLKCEYVKIIKCTNVHVLKFNMSMTKCLHIKKNFAAIVHCVHLFLS